ncbi:MAG: hypothetical protein M1832_004529 [Thelocarpon impressellum]|nr:MAG: hypothetical protein M1832_004529 [Thelocarpon impressellum]
MANSSLVPSACIFPFLAEADFPAKGGHVPGRFCQKIDLLGGASCCLPCPETDWVYGDRLNTAVEATNWVAVVGLLGCAFLLGSYAVLPVGRTHRYYLSTCVTFATALMMLAFVVPLGSRPDKCFDAITPHDMKSDTTCAASGFFLLYGGFTALMWVFLRALDLYLQICWQVTTGRKFVILAHVLGWGLSAAIVTGTMVISGMSYRLGTTCVPNHQGAVKNFWAPAFVVAGITALLQFST